MKQVCEKVKLSKEEFESLYRGFGDQVVDASNYIMLNDKYNSTYKCGYQKALVDCLQFFSNLYISKIEQD